ncbi:DUF4349 domain-containing protein [Bacillus sp. CGMCC 1.16607]|uniref:DUF4349 domain-containing protein n=1 Tax=Bacillus sp. CGMCC 1.16607 TaxID=3351842 RepID=UPI00364347D1
MKKWCKTLVSFIFILLLAACSSDSKESAKSDLGSALDQATSEMENSLSMGGSSEQKSKSVSAETKKSVERMVIYKADVRLRVKNYEKAQQELEIKAKNLGGFVVQSNVYRSDGKQMSGTITLRIPGEHFGQFLQDAEGMAEEVIERNVNGEDVTEEYVDLESRLRSKRVVEERLLDFMKKAQKTEDLLRISNDLGVVQEEIEKVLGRMKYLENQTSYSTITINLYEENVIIPKIEKGELDTWEKTKKQFVTSTNFLLSAFSGLFVFIIGNLPVLLFITAILFILYFIMKRYMKRPTDVNHSIHRDEDQ